MLGQCLFVIHGQLEFRCIVSSLLCGCCLVDGSLLSCCSWLHLRALHVSRLPENRFHPLVFICCRLVSSRLHRRFSCLFVSYLRPCRLVGLIGQLLKSLNHTIFRSTAFEMFEIKLLGGMTVLYLVFILCKFTNTNLQQNTTVCSRLEIWNTIQQNILHVTV